MGTNKTTGNSHNKNSSTYHSKRSCPTSTLSSSSQKSILDMLPKKKKKPDTCKSNNIKGEEFSLGSNQNSANQQYFKCRLTLVQIRRMKTKVKTKTKNLLKQPMKTGFNQQEQHYSKYIKFRLSGRFHFHFHFIHLAKMVGCVSYTQNTGKGMIFGDLKQLNEMNTLIEYFPNMQTA